MLNSCLNFNTCIFTGQYFLFSMHFWHRRYVPVNPNLHWNSYTYLAFNNWVRSSTGDRRLEICSNGAGQAVPVGVHLSLSHRHRAHHLASALPLRPLQTHRHLLLQNCEKEVNDDGPGRGLKNFQMNHMSQDCSCNYNYLLNTRRKKEVLKLKYLYITIMLFVTTIWLYGSM